MNFVRKLLLLLSGLAAWTCSVRAQWSPIITNYGKDDYKAGAQNWCITRGPNGWFYFGNRQGVLEYNGFEWNLYRMDNGQIVHSLAMSADSSRIYVGGINEFGCLAPDEVGRMRYENLSDRLGLQSLFGNVWNIFEIDRSIIFCCDDSVLKMVDGKVSVIECPDKLDCAAVVNNTLYIGTPSGIFILAGNVFHPHVGCGELSGKKLRAIIPSDSFCFVFTERDGIFRLDDDGMTRYATAADEFMRNNYVFSAVLRDNHLYIGTIMRGVVSVSLETCECRYYNSSHGLQNNTVLSLYADDDGVMWLGLNSGISSVPTRSTLNQLCMPKELYSSGYSAAIFGGSLFLATSNGVYDVDWPAAISMENTEIDIFNGIKGQTWSLAVVDDRLICCLDSGIEIVDEAHRIVRSYALGTGVWGFRRTLSDPDAAWVNTYNGMFISRRRGGEWERPVKIMGLNISVDRFVEVSPHVLIFRDGNSDIHRLVFDSSDTRIIDHKLLNIKINPNQTIFAGCGRRLVTPDTFYRYDADAGLVPDSEMNALLKRYGLGGSLCTVIDGANVWTVTDKMLYRIDTVTGRSVTLPHHLQILTQYGDVVPVAGEQAIVASESGFAIWNSRECDTVRPLRAEITDIAAMNRSKERTVFVNSGRRSTVRIGYRENTIRVRYRLAQFAGDDGARFSYRLDGGAWSDPSDDRVAVIGDISDGEHTFEVRAAMRDGRSASDSVRIVVPVPWFRSVWAYAIYAVALAGILAGIWWLDDLRIRSKNRTAVAAEKRIAVENERIYRQEAARRENEILRLKNEKIMIDVEHKNQELANIAINLTRKNEILTDIKKDVEKIAAELKNSGADTPPLAIRTKLLTVKSKIEQNIVNDDALKDFEEHFDLVHNNFMKRLSADYPALTLSERKMCAYIRMHLSTKEIAPLLNISVRGAETMRYRLRHKLGLDKNASLTEFLNRY